MRKLKLKKKESPESNSYTIEVKPDTHRLFYHPHSREPAYTHSKSSKLTPEQKAQAQAILMKLARFQFNNHVINWSIVCSEDNHIMAWGELKTDISEFKDKLKSNANIVKYITQIKYPQLYHLISTDEYIVNADKIFSLEKEIEFLRRSIYIDSSEQEQELIFALSFMIMSAKTDQTTDAFLFAEMMYAYIVKSASNEQENITRLPVKVGKVKDKNNHILFIPHVDELTEADIAKVQIYYDLRFCLTSYNDDVEQFINTEDFQPVFAAIQKESSNAQQQEQKFNQKFFKKVTNLVNDENKIKTVISIPDDSSKNISQLSIDTGFFLVTDKFHSIICDYFKRNNILHTDLAALEPIKDYPYLRPEYKEYIRKFNTLNLKEVYFVSMLNGQHLPTVRQAAMVASILIGEWRVENCCENAFTVSARITPELYKMFEGNLDNEFKKNIDYDANTETLKISLLANSSLKEKIQVLAKFNKVCPQSLENKVSYPKPF